MKHFSSRAVIVTLMLLIMPGCGSNPAGPPPTPRLTVTCPAASSSSSPGEGTGVVTRNRAPNQSPLLHTGRSEAITHSKASALERAP